MKSYLTIHKKLIGIYLIWFVSGFSLLLYFGNTEFSLRINQHVFLAADLFFGAITYLGDGYFALALGLLFWFLKQPKNAFLLWLNYAISSGTTQLLKRFVFADHHRPLKIIPHVQLHFPYGMELVYHHSFPSGHSTTVFAWATLLALFSKQKNAAWFYMSLAVLVAFSRIYLLQHFLGDTLAGSCIGFTSACLVFYVGWYKKHDSQTTLGLK